MTSCFYRPDREIWDEKGGLIKKGPSIPSCWMLDHTESLEWDLCFQRCKFGSMRFWHWLSTAASSISKDRRSLRRQVRPRLPSAIRITCLRSRQILITWSTRLFFPDESSFCLIYFVIYRHYIFTFSTGVVVWSLQSSSKFEAEVSSYEYSFTTWNVKTAC